MPEYVYALHDFHPENEDEVSFLAGERIEVVEKDDLYGDGWWQGRNLAGKVGLFPQSYTAPAPPEAITHTASTSSTASDTTVMGNGTKTILQPLDEVSESGSPSISASNIIAPVPKTPAILHDKEEEAEATDSEDAVPPRVSSDGEMMKATMTDVQKAIEQLGRQGRNGDGEESFSFASSKGDHTGGETDTDFDMSDVDGADTDDLGEGWHKGARRKLAAKAKRAVEEAEKLEAIMNNSERRMVAPPIDVELSDESEGEEGEYTTRIFPREHPYILEEDEDVETDPERLTPAQHKRELSENNTVKRSSTDTDSNHVIVPERDESDEKTATATRAFFPVFPSPPTFPYAEVSAVQTPEALPVSKHSSPIPPSSPVQAVHSIVTFPEPQRNGTPLRESTTALPSPTGSSHGISNGALFAVEHVRHGSVGSSPSTKTPGSLLSQPPVTASSMPNTLVDEKKDKTHPTEWSVEEVVEWLKSKGFDQDVCGKFTEQEITGDVLLELDVNLLKSEIGIMAFGKRMRIANAITDLRRPPSIIYSDHPEQLSMPSPQTHTPLSPQSMTHTHSRNQSQSQSHHSYPGTYSQSSVGNTQVYGNGNGFTYGSVVTETPAQQYTAPPAVKDMGAEMNGEQGVGLGIALSSDAIIGKGPKSRPAHLSLSPSDSALGSRAVLNVPEEDDDRGHVSEGEAAHSTSIRQRLFGRTVESPNSKIESAGNSRHSQEGTTSVAASPITLESGEKDKSKGKNKDKEKDSASLGSRHARSKRSIDGGRNGERLSIFGLGGTLGKSRKPPPRYPSTSDDGIEDKEKEKERGTSMFGLPRLHSSSIRKSSSTSYRTSASNSLTSKEMKEKTRDMENAKEAPYPAIKEIKEKETRDPALLRKRTSSAPNVPITSELAKISGNGVVSPLKQGQSILEQIGETDHNGWMRKRGDRYNSWKLRYFVLKGPHMYCLKSNSKSETRIKGYINIVGYKVTVDENVNPGRYGFRIEHEDDKTHYFSSDEKAVIRDWMKAIMKATIGRDYTRPVISSCNIPTIPLTVAQAMNPAPRPPSPTARAAMQKALRRENPDQLSSRDARVLMGLPSSADGKEERTRLDAFFSNEAVNNGDNRPLTPPKSPVPPRPSREMRRSIKRTSNAVEESLIEWANTYLPQSLQITDSTDSLTSGLALLRLAESVTGHPSSPPVPDSAFPANAADDKLDGLFRLFDFLLDNDVKMGSVSINDIRLGKRDKVFQLIRALKAWEDKRKAIAQSIGSTSVQAGSFMAPAGMASTGMMW